MLDPKIAKGLLVARRNDIEDHTSATLEKEAIFNAGLVKSFGNILTGAGAAAGAGVGALAGGEGNRLGGAFQGAMIGLAPGLLVKGMTKAPKIGVAKETTAVSKSGGPSAPTANNPTAGN